MPPPPDHEKARPPVPPPPPTPVTKIFSTPLMYMHAYSNIYRQINLAVLLPRSILDTILCTQYLLRKSKLYVIHRVHNYQNASGRMYYFSVWVNNFNIQEVVSIYRVAQKECNDFDR